MVSSLVYAGGGNTVVLFCSLETAREFTRRALQHAPGLRLVIAHDEFDWDIQVLSQVVQDTLEKVRRKKNDPVDSTSLRGLSVTADCQYTGLPAVGKNQDGKRVSAELSAKGDVFEVAHRRLTEMPPLDGLRFREILMILAAPRASPVTSRSSIPTVMGWADE